MISVIVKMQPTTPRLVAKQDIFKTAYIVENGKMKLPDSDVEEDDVRRTTLVLAPASLLQQVRNDFPSNKLRRGEWSLMGLQWYEEVMEKTEQGTLTAHIHHGKDKLKSVKELQSFDVRLSMSFFSTFDPTRWLRRS